MDDSEGSSVTLIFYRVGEQWWKEPFLNILAAAAQMSSLTHVEIAIGEEAGVNGMMTNVCRVFNDRVGVELVERTGRNPQYVYQQLGCSKKAVSRMLHYARTRCVGKPFSNVGMARSLLWPRHTDSSSFFCAGARTPPRAPRAPRPHHRRAPRARVVAAAQSSWPPSSGRADSWTERPIQEARRPRCSTASTRTARP